METRTDQDAKDKVLELLKGINIAMMATHGDNGQMHARPMADRAQDPMRQIGRIKPGINFSVLLSLDNDVEDEIQIAPALPRVDALGWNFFRGCKNGRKKQAKQTANTLSAKTPMA